MFLSHFEFIDLLACCFRCVISRDLLICSSGKQLHGVKFSQKEAKAFTLELDQEIANIDPVKSGERAGVFLDFAATGLEQSHQAVFLSEQGQSSVTCKVMPSSAHWVLSDPNRDDIFVVQLVLRNEVSPY